MKKKQIKGILNAGLKSLKNYLNIPCAIKKGGPSHPIKDWEQLLVTVEYSANNVDAAMKNLAYRLNYRNRFYKHGRIGIPKEKLGVIFANLELTHSIEGQVGNYRGISMRVCRQYDIFRDMDIIRFDVLVKFVNRAELQAN